MSRTAFHKNVKKLSNLSVDDIRIAQEDLEKAENLIMATIRHKAAIEGIKHEIEIYRDEIMDSISKIPPFMKAEDLESIYKGVLRMYEKGEAEDDVHIVRLENLLEKLELPPRFLPPNETSKSAKAKTKK